MSNTATAKQVIKSMGYKASDFSVKAITGFATSVSVMIRAKNPALTAADFAKVENAFPFGKAMVFDSNGTTMIWA